MKPTVTREYEKEVAAGRSPLSILLDQFHVHMENCGFAKTNDDEAAYRPAYEFLQLWESAGNDLHRTLVVSGFYYEEYDTRRMAELFARSWAWEDRPRREK